MSTRKLPLRLGLQARITALTVLGLLALFVAMGFIGLRNQAASMDVVLQQRVALVETVAAHVEYRTGYMLDELAAVAAGPGFDLTDADLAPEQAALADLFRSGMFTYDVFFTDARGIVLAVEPEVLRADLVGADFSQHPHIRRALETGQPQVSGLMSGVAATGLSVSLVVPVKNSEGETVGLIGGALDPAGPVISGFIVSAALGETGYAQVVDGQGMVVASTRPGAAGAASDHLDVILALLERGQPTVSPDSPVTEEGEEFREVIAFAPIPRLGWGVTVEQDRAEALAPVISARNQIMVVAVIALAVAMLFVWFTARQVTKPVLTLVGAARRIASGDFGAPVVVGGRDEVAELGHGFEAMRQKLAAWGEELEVAVQKRTRELFALYAIDRAAAQSLELEQILNDALDKVLEVLEVEAGGIYLLEADGETMTLRAHRGISDEFVESIRRLRLGEGVTGRAMAERKPVVLDVADYPTARLATLVARDGLQTFASTPLVSGGEVVGALTLGTRRPRAFPPEEMELLTAIGRQLGGAVANARLHQETRQRAERLAILNRIAHALAATLNLDELLEIVHREIMAVVEADTFFIALYDGETNELDFRIQIDKGVREPPERRPLAPGLTAAVVTGKQPLLIRDFEREKDRLPPAKLWGTMEAPASWLGLPLLLGGPSAPLRVIGVISVQAYRPGAFDEADQQVLSTIANAVAVAVENARLYEAEQRRATRLAALQSLGIELAALRDESSVLTTLVTRTAALAESPTCTVMLVDETTGEAVLTAQTGLPEGTLPELRVPLSLPVIRRSLESGEPILLADIDRDAPEMRALLVRADIRAFFAYPMMREGRALGFITLSRLTPRRPSAEEVTAYRLLAGRAAAALENARLYQKVAASEQEYRTLVENAAELIWTLDTEGRFTFINRQAEEVSGYKAEDWLGKSFAPLIAPPEDLPRIQRVFLKTLAGQPQSYEVGVSRPDGGRLYLSVNTTPQYRDGHAQVVGTISFARDVTAEKEAEAALTQRMAELSALFEVSSALRGVETVEEMLPVILEATIRVAGADAGVILLRDPAAGDLTPGSGQALVVRAGAGRMAHLLGSRLPIDDNVPSRVLADRQPYIIRQAASESLIPATLREQLQGIETAIVLPLQMGESAIGVMNIAYTAPHTFAEAEIRLLTAIADMAASAIRRASLFEELEHRVHELAALFDVGKMVTATLHIEDVLDFIVGAACRTLHSEGSYIFLWDEREERLVMRAVQGFLPQLVGQVKYRLGEGLSGWMFLEGRSVNVPDVAADPRWKPEPESEKTLAAGRVISALMSPLIVGAKTLGVLGVANKTGGPAFTASDESLLTTLASQIAIAIENARLYEDVRGLSTAAIRSLAAAIDARDPYTRGHSEGVTRLAVGLAHELGWSGADLEMLEFAALLHDVGKIAVPDAILRKVEPLTPDEWAVIRLHPYHSAQIVKPVEPLQRIIPWIYHHHERWDGTGYPDGLKGEDIPRASRIIAVADAYNAMTTDRPYRKALSKEEALAEMARCAGVQFDPGITEAYLCSILLDLEKLG